MDKSTKTCPSNCKNCYWVKVRMPVSSFGKCFDIAQHRLKHHEPVEWTQDYNPERGRRVSSLGYGYVFFIRKT